MAEWKDIIILDNISNSYNSNEILKKKNVLIKKVINDNNLTKEEKEIFLNDINKISLIDLNKVIDFTNSDYEELIKWIKFKWTIDKLIKDFDDIDSNIDLLKKETNNSVSKHENKSRNLDIASADNIINNFV